MVEGSSRCAKPRSIVMPRAFSSGNRSGSMPVIALTNALLPWSTWPAVARMKCWVVMGVPMNFVLDRAIKTKRAVSFDLVSQHGVNGPEQRLILPRKHRAQIQLEPVPGDMTDHGRCPGAQSRGKIVHGHVQRQKIERDG